MPLSDDQRAMLRLLAQREEGYEDIAALKGMGVEEVRAEVKEALAQLAADREAGLEPPVESDESVVSQPVEPPAQPVPPVAPEPAPAQPAPAAQEPPVAPAKKAPPAPAAKKPSRPRPSLGGPLRNVPPARRRLLLLTGGAVAVVAVVLIAIAVLGGGSDSSGSSEPSAAATEAAAAEGKVIQAALEPADGSDASGRAIFGKVGKEEVVLQVTAEGLQPSEQGKSYTVWLYRTPKLSLRIGSVSVGDSGELGARFPIPAELLAYVASGAFDQIHVTLTEDAAYKQEVAQAKKEKTLPRYLGETVLAGEITGPVGKK